MLETRKLGRNGPKVSAPGPARMGMSQSSGIAEERDEKGSLAGNVRRAEEYPPTDFRHDDPRYQGGNFDANMRAAKVVRELAAKKNATAAQVALAWLLHKGDDVVPIPGTKRRRYLEENVGAASLALSAEELRTLDEALAPGRIAGPRYSPQRMAQIDET